jgi:hypothetical protein
MKHALTVLIGLLPLTNVLADQPASAPPNVRFVTMDKRDIPLEDLAHSFLFHFSDSNRLKSLISEEGLARIQPELAELRNEMTDLRKIAPRTRQMCTRLQGAKNGQEFAAVFVDAERSQQTEMQRHARRILSTFDVNDRAALERYLDVEYRQSFNRVKFDYDAMYSSASFPSTETNAIMQKTCDSAKEMEARVVP